MSASGRWSMVYLPMPLALRPWCTFHTAARLVRVYLPMPPRSLHSLHMVCLPMPPLFVHGLPSHASSLSSLLALCVPPHAFTLRPWCTCRFAPRPWSALPFLLAPCPWCTFPCLFTPCPLCTFSWLFAPRFLHKSEIRTPTNPHTLACCDVCVALVTVLAHTHFHVGPCPVPGSVLRVVLQQRTPRIQSTGD